MPPNIATLEQEALLLPPSERAELIERLICSLGPDEAVLAAWAAEADRRAHEIDSGQIEALDGAETLRALRAELE